MPPKPVTSSITTRLALYLLKTGVASCDQRGLGKSPGGPKTSTEMMGSALATPGGGSALPANTVAPHGDTPPRSTNDVAAYSPGFFRPFLPSPTTQLQFPDVYPVHFLSSSLSNHPPSPHIIRSPSIAPFPLRQSRATCPPPIGRRCDLSAPAPRPISMRHASLSAAV